MFEHAFVSLCFIQPNPNNGCLFIFKLALVEPDDYVRYENAPGGEYQYHRGLEDSNISTGFVRIPSEGTKPNRNALMTSVVRYIPILNTVISDECLGAFMDCGD